MKILAFLLVPIISICCLTTPEPNAAPQILTEMEVIEEVEPEPDSTRLYIEEEIIEEEKEVEPTEIVVNATAYCSCKKCCGKWAENRPNGIVLTASGKPAKPEHTVAVDPDYIPFGTILVIDGIEYVAEDTGSAINDNDIDIYFDNHEEALKFGRQELIAYIKE